MTKQKLLLLTVIILLGFIFMKIINIGNSSQDLAVYVNDEYQGSIPKKGEALFQKAVCDNDVKASWNNDSWSLIINNLSQKTKCNLYFYQGETVFNFDYTGDEQTFTVPVTGTYKLETWGAQGGSYKDAIGGYGGYSTGVVSLTAKNKIYINVGGSGISNSIANASGGYNGGGRSSFQQTFENDRYFSSGGGATHISFDSGLLYKLKGLEDKILIVSGGGGGSYFSIGNSVSANGGSAGGYVGNNGIETSEGWGTAGFGGTQTSPGYSLCDVTTCNSTNNGLDKRQYGVADFGLGGANSVPSSGGGSGYYGGGASVHVQSGGGGSSYIGNSMLINKSMYCYNCTESSEESTKTVSTTCSEETPTENCAKKGNGYARITLISVNE